MKKVSAFWATPMVRESSITRATLLFANSNVCMDDIAFEIGCTSLSRLQCNKSDGMPAFKWLVSVFQNCFGV
jgi:hypothetical protein